MNPEPDTSPVRLTREGPIARLTLNRAAKKNAANARMWRAIADLTDEARRMEGLRVLIVSGEGDSFAAGADIAEMGALIGDEAGAADYAATFSRAMQAVADFPHPVLAMIRGACIGGGCGLALACDYRFADSTAKLGVTPAKLGLLYTVDDTKRLIDAVGVSRAKSMLFTASVYDAADAKAFGLVDEVIAPEALEAAVTAHADRIASLSPFTITAMKRFVKQAQARGEDEESRRAFAKAFAGPSFAEGFLAFKERRAPQFSEEQES